MNSILLNSLLLLLGTSAGSLLALTLKKVPLSVNLNLAFAGGVMMVASFTSLIVPGIETGGFLQTSLGIISGFLLIGLMENLFPHEHAIKGYEGALHTKRLKKLMLVTIGVVIHNIPEGFGVGVSSAYSMDKGYITAIAISLQDIPEGLIVSLSLMVIKDKVLIPLTVGLASGAVESLFSLLGFYTFDVFKEALAFGLGLGGGAMIYIIIKEVFPEVYSDGSSLISTVGFLLGFLLMLLLDTSL